MEFFEFDKKRTEATNVEFNTTPRQIAFIRVPINEIDIFIESYQCKLINKIDNVSFYAEEKEPYVKIWVDERFKDDVFYLIKISKDVKPYKPLKPLKSLKKEDAENG